MNLTAGANQTAESRPVFLAYFNASAVRRVRGIQLSTLAKNL
jgi:hypothetical protein